MELNQLSYQAIKADNSYCHSNRIDPVELLSAVFIVVVLFLHHRGYTTDYSWLLPKYKITLFLQKLSIGGFIFLSGFKLAKSKLSEPARSFAINRFFRIYLLYLLALIVFSFTAYPHLNKGAFPSWPNFILHAFCIQSIVPYMIQRNYHTLWFVSILFCCYGFFVLTREALQMPYFFFVVLLIALLCIFAIHHIGAMYDVNIFQRYLNTYLAFFAFGMIYSKIQKRIDILNVKLLLCLFLVGFLGLTLLYNTIRINTWYESLTEFFLILISTLPLYCITFKMAPKLYLSNQVVRTLKCISYSSLCIFLFHRPIWAVMETIWDSRSFYQWLFIMVIGIPTIFTLSYVTQSTYDRIIVNIRHKKAPQPTR